MEGRKDRPNSRSPGVTIERTIVWTWSVEGKEMSERMRGRPQKILVEGLSDERVFRNRVSDEEPLRFRSALERSFSQTLSGSDKLVQFGYPRNRRTLTGHYQFLFSVRHNNGSSVLRNCIRIVRPHLRVL